MDLENIDHHLNLVLRSAWADSTLSTRNSQWSRFIKFCKAKGLTPVPADQLTVARFLISLAMSCAFSTCNNYLSAIICLHKFMGYPGDYRQRFMIQMVIKGLARKLGKHVDQKVGLTPDNFVSIYSRLSFADVNNLTKWAALMLSFRSLLRKSNLVQTNLSDLGSVVQRSDLVFSNDGLVLNVRKTKTIQNNEYVLQVPVSYVNNACFCAATMVRTHLARTSHISHGPIFYVWCKGTWRPLLYRELLDFLKSCVKLIGMDPSSVGLHSMRRSGAAFLHSIGISLVDIMNAGDWKSLAALSYLISPLSRKEVIDKTASAALLSFSI